MKPAMWSLEFGATVRPGGVEFRVWAPRLQSVDVVIHDQPQRVVAMRPEDDGVFSVFVPGARAGTGYMFRNDLGRQFPDPVSRWQPHGVHGPSRVVDRDAFEWSDRGWNGLALQEFLIYELHTGTFTSEGTFESAIERLPYLKDLGITAIEVMPVAQFPGRHNWGYDGVGLYAPHSSYGGPAGLKALIDACHLQGLAVVLDVVYNHVGPEGNYLAEFGPYFTSSYQTPWGEAINYDGPGSDGVRRFVVENALYWMSEYHVDALRLDAIHGIYDFGARHILREMADTFHEQAQLHRRRAWLIAESDLNDPRVIRSPRLGGHGVDAQWLDEFHHSLQTAMIGDRRGYFADYDGLQSLSKVLTDGYVYDGQHSAYRQRRYGASSKDRPGEQFVVCTQNHDQIANAFQGTRVSKLLSADQQKVAAAILFFSPFLPMLFMGQEYGETAPFHFFTDHGDPALIEAAREGRRKEIESYLNEGQFADPQSSATFEECKLDWKLPCHPPHSSLLAWYRDFIAVRKKYPALYNCRKDLVQVADDPQGGWLVISRGDADGSRALLVCSLTAAPQAIPISFRDVTWSLRLWSGFTRYGPPSAVPEARILAGAPGSIVLPGIDAALYISD